MGHSPGSNRANGTGLGMTATYTHTRPETRRKQLEAALQILMPTVAGEEFAGSHVPDADHAINARRSQRLAVRRETGRAEHVPDTVRAPTPTTQEFKIHAFHPALQDFGDQADHGARPAGAHFPEPDLAVADGYPGVPKIGAKTAARLIARYGAIDQFPAHILDDRLELAQLFKKLATLRTDAPLFSDVEALRWRGLTDGFAATAEQIGAPGFNDANCQADAHAVTDYLFVVDGDDRHRLPAPARR